MYKNWTEATYYTNCGMYPYELGTRGSIVGWGTMLQARRLRLQVPMTQIFFFFNLANSSSCTMALSSTWPLTEMSTRNLPEE
jgi:hypothetical protein